MKGLVFDIDCEIMQLITFENLMKIVSKISVIYLDIDKIISNIISHLLTTHIIRVLGVLWHLTSKYS